MWDIYIEDRKRLLLQEPLTKERINILFGKRPFNLEIMFKKVKGKSKKVN